LWEIKNLFSPLDRRLYRWTGGRGVMLGQPLAPRLLITTTGRRTGREHTIPVFYLHDGNRIVICNVNPGFEHPNPWTLNLRAHPVARVRIGATTDTYHARVATEQEVERYWPRLVALWPAYQAFYQRGGARTLFVLEPDYDAVASGESDIHLRATSAPGGEAAGALRELQR
jgi:deazaflavin-dependent oxidoreductase (nitroreductase family)